MTTRDITFEILGNIQDRLAALERESLRNDARFKAIDARFDAVDARFDAMDARFDAMDARFDAMDARFDAMHLRFEALESAFSDVQSALVSELDQVRKMLGAVLDRLPAIGTVGRRLEERVDDHEQRIATLERE